MSRSVTVLVLSGLLTHGISYPQTGDRPSTKVTYAELEMKSFPKDSSANAVVLDELGDAYITDDEEIIFDYYAKIKILNRNGFSRANFSVPLSKNSSEKEELLSVEGSTFNLNNGTIRQSKMDLENVFTENRHKYQDVKKFTLPDIHEGSVLEIKYRIRSPFKTTFRTWEFQDDIPKVHSEFWALIPANYVYNVTLRGFLKLSKSETARIMNCFKPHGNSADCSQLKYAIDNVPAFKDEDYMTARKNWISALYFELSEVKHFDGTSVQFTHQWKDIDDDLRLSDGFGQQIRKARNLMEEKVKSIVRTQSEEMAKARLIFSFIKSWYTWDKVYGMYTEFGAKQSYETKQGNVADINLSLVAALQSAGLTAFPVILSTRGNGLPIEIHPVMSGFNYVVASVEIDGNHHFLDATNPHQPFGLVPMRCLNGKGRLMSKESSWIEMKPQDKKKSVITAELNLGQEGIFRGKFKNTYYGYDALEKRAEIFSVGGIESHLTQLRKTLGDVEVSGYTVENLNEVESPLTENMEIEIKTEVANAQSFFFNPFIFDKWKNNPFKSNTRFYPVDFGAPTEQIFVLTLSYPDNLFLDEVPENVALTLPQGGGRYTFSVTPLGNKLSVNSSLVLSRSTYNSAEYHYLRELFARVVQIQQSQIVFKRR